MTAELYEAARRDFRVYAPLVHTTDTGGRAFLEPHHELMAEALLDEARGPTLILAPRGAAKTTILQYYLEWSLGRASELDEAWAERWRTAYISNTAGQAYRLSNAMRETIEGNAEYHRVFPKVRPHKTKWSQDEWKVAGNRSKDANFAAMGVDGPAMGLRASTIVFDDPADAQNMATRYQRDLLLGSEDGQVPGRFDLVFMPMLVPGGRGQLMLTTRWHQQDPAWWAMQRGWHTILLKSLDEAGNSYWPERFPVEVLLKLREQTPGAFARQYQNEVAPAEGLTFLREWFEHRFDVAPSPILCVMNSWDTAAGQGRNRSFSVGLEAVVTQDYHIYITGMVRGQMPYSYLRDAVRQLWERSRASKVIIEKKSSGHALCQDWMLAGIDILEWQPFGQKGSPSWMQANEAITDFCAQGNLHLPSDYYCRRQGGSWLHEFEEELFAYPESQETDIVSALNQLVFWVWGLRQKHRALLYLPRRMGWARDRTQAVGL